MKKNDDYGRHEALHTASIMVDMVDRHLLEHQVIHKNKHYKKLAKEAFKNLYALYQAIGADHLLPKEKKEKGE